MNFEFKEILIFQIEGKFAHFKKFYSNKSSLTYKIPTRTVIMGLIASILEEERDSYYDWLSPENSKIGLQIIKNGYPHFECMNYLMDNGGHTQVRLELLKGREENIVYQIYFTSKNLEKLNLLEKKIENSQLGYGVYLGQRPFKGSVNWIGKTIIKEIKEKFECELSTLTYQSNVINLGERSCQIAMERMPVSFAKNIVKVKKEIKQEGRKPEPMDNFIYEETGKKIKGKFNQIIALENNENISFFTSLK